MLGLKLPTDPRWSNIVESNIESVLIDHAWCEHKAAMNAMQLIVKNPEKLDLVQQMGEIAMEEMEHFNQVCDLIKERGFTLKQEQKDDYVGKLVKFIPIGGSRNSQLIERLLFSAMIEARSCERFKVLSENIKDEKLAEFYHKLMVSEANHYTVFLNFAKKYAKPNINVTKRWNKWLEYEASVITSYGKKEEIHG